MQPGWVSKMTTRGARVRARIYRATTLYSVGPRTRTMMQSYASVAKLRSGGPILCYGVISHGVLHALRRVDRASFATAPPAPACRPSQCQCPSHAPAGAPWHALPRRVRARGDPGVRSRSDGSDRARAVGAPCCDVVQTTCWAESARPRACASLEVVRQLSSAWD